MFFVRKLNAVLVLMLILLGGSATSLAQEINYKAYTLFVYNFMKYIEWPQESSSKNDFVIGVVGESPIVKELQSLAQVKKVKGKTIIVKQISSVEEAVTCNLIYITSPKSSILKTLNEKIKSKPILLVAEREGLARKGAALSFITLEDEDILKFEINKSAIEGHYLKIPTVLISLGLLVG